MLARPARPDPLATQDEWLVRADTFRRVLRGDANPPSLPPYPHFLPHPPVIVKNGKQVRRFPAGANIASRWKLTCYGARAAAETAE
jgi:hypothetical protein